jgi:DNA-binding NarL/FixJ family response regulator
MTDEYVGPPATAAELTPRQLAVAALIARARTDKQIAHELGIQRRTVGVHLTALAYRLHLDAASNVRVQIALWWRAQTPAIRTEDAA